MSRIWIQTEEIWQKRRCRCDGCFGIERQPNWITSDQLVEVLNSAANKGPDRDCVLRSESMLRELTAEEKACAREFAREMEENVIPEIVRVMQKRAELAEESRRKFIRA